MSYTPGKLVEKRLYKELPWEKLIEGIRQNQALGWSQKGAILCVLDDCLNCGQRARMQWSHQQQSLLLYQYKK